MKFKIRFADQIVGLFILLAILGLAGVLILLASNQRWFAKNYSFSSRFKSAEGLSVGMPIKLKGFEIGRVTRIHLSSENLVDIEFHVYDNYYDKVLPNSVLEHTSNPLGLAGGLVFHPGKTAPGYTSSVPEFSFIPSLDLDEGKRLVKEGLVVLPKGEDVVGSVIVTLNSVLSEVQELVASLNEAMQGRGQGPVGAVINDLPVTTSRLNALLEHLKNISSNLEQTTTALKDPKGMVKTLLDPKGSLATFLDDDNALYNQVTEALEEVNAILAQFREFSRFVNSSQPQFLGLLEKGRITLDKSNDVLEAVKNNPLLRGGVPPRREQPSTLTGYRDEDF